MCSYGVVIPNWKSLRSHCQEGIIHLNQHPTYFLIKGDEDPV